MPEIHSSEASIIHDGITPQGDVLQRWIDSWPNGTGTDPLEVWIDGQICTDIRTADVRYPSTPTILGKPHFFIHGQDHSLVRHAEYGDRNASHLRFVHCNYFGMEALGIAGSASQYTGYNRNYEAQHAFDFQSCHHAELSDCWGDGIWGDGLNMSKDRPGDSWCDDFSVVDFHFGTVHRHGASLGSGASNVRIFGLLVDQCRTGVDIEPASTSAGARNISFTQCTWRGHSLNLFACAPKYGIVDEILFDQCASPGRPFSVVVKNLQSAELGNFRLRDCWSDKADGNGKGAIMQFTGVKGDIEVVRCHQPVQSGRTPVMRVARVLDEDVYPGLFTYYGCTPADLG